MALNPLDTESLADWFSFILALKGEWRRGIINGHRVAWPQKSRRLASRRHHRVHSIIKLKRNNSNGCQASADSARSAFSWPPSLCA